MAKYREMRSFGKSTLRHSVKKILLLLLTGLLPTAFAHAQSPENRVFEAFEVDSAAQPVGGMRAYYRHLAHQLRVPFAARVAGAKGRVAVSGVVNSDSTLSDLTVLRGLRPDCDAEALRVVKLFQNWQPALKAGQPVRQKTMVLVEFRPQPVTLVGKKVMTFYRSDGTETTQAAEADIVLRYAADSSGNPVHEVEFLNSAGEQLNQARRVRQRVVNAQDEVAFPAITGFGPATTPGAPTGRTYWLTGFQASDGRIIGPAAYADEKTEQRYAEAFLTGDVHAPLTTFYFPSGLKRRIQPAPDRTGYVYEWYDNGQIRYEAVQEPSDSVDFYKRPILHQRVLNTWSRTGQSLVREGTGTDRREFRVGRAYEEITYREGLPERIVGYDSTGQKQYEERLRAGRFLEGTRYDGEVPIHYSAARPAEFTGGQAGLANFLQHTLKYPPGAAREGAQGKVFVTFVIDQQGQVLDTRVLRSVHPALDAEALRVVRASSGQWVPAQQRGRLIKSRFNLPISFVTQ